MKFLLIVIFGLFLCLNSSFKPKLNVATPKYIIYVNFSKSIDKNRFFVVRISDRKIILRTRCAHAFKSGGEYANIFSNIKGSRMTSLGNYRIAEKYVGGWGKSYRLDGLDKSNSNARIRNIVLHTTDKMKTKWSWGCLSIPSDALEILYTMDLRGVILKAFL